VRFVVVVLFFMCMRHVSPPLSFLVGGWHDDDAYGAVRVVDG